MEMEQTAIVDVRPHAEGFGTRPPTGRPHSINLFGRTPTAEPNGQSRALDILLGVGIGAMMMYLLDRRWRLPLD